MQPNWGELPEHVPSNTVRKIPTWGWLQYFRSHHLIQGKRSPQVFSPEPPQEGASLLFDINHPVSNRELRALQLSEGGDRVGKGDLIIITRRDLHQSTWILFQGPVIPGVRGPTLPSPSAGNRNGGDPVPSICSPPHSNKEIFYRYYSQNKRPTPHGDYVNIKCSCWKRLDSTLFQKNYTGRLASTM